jgi:hypothetical protein
MKWSDAETHNTLSNCVTELLDIGKIYFSTSHSIPSLKHPWTNTVSRDGQNRSLDAITQAKHSLGYLNKGVAPYRTLKVIDNGKQGQSKLTFTALGDSRDKGVFLTTESYGLTEGFHS